MCVFVCASVLVYLHCACVFVCVCVCSRVHVDVCVCDCARWGEGLMNEYVRVCVYHVRLSMCFRVLV